MLSRNQFQLPFPIREDLSFQSFVVSDANKEAWQFVKSWPNWGSRILIIEGEEGSGKTHLAELWRAESGAKYLPLKSLKDASALIMQHLPHTCVIVEHLETIESSDEAGLFHLINLIQESQGYLLLTSRNPLKELSIRLPDLASRLQGALCTRIAPPDDFLLGIILQKKFSDRQLRVGEEVIRYLISRIDRSYASIQKAVEGLDQLASAESRDITVPLARAYLKE